VAGRKARSDSVDAAVKAAIAAALPPIEAPAHLKITDSAMPFFQDLLKEKCREEWTDAQLANAAMAARLCAQIEKDQIQLSLEESLVDYGFGLTENKLVKLIAKSIASKLALERAMGINPTAKTPVRDLNKKRGTEKTARRLAQEVAAEDDSLLA
jgi:hypothetical protein